MYVEVKEIGWLYIEMTIGRSRPDKDEKEDFDYDHNLLVDGMAARIYKSVKHRIHIKSDIDTWTLLFDRYPQWQEDLEKVFTDLKLEFKWEFDRWLECPINQYLYSRSNNTSSN